MWPLSMHASQEAYPTQRPKLHLTRFSRFFAAHCRESLYFTMDRPSPPLKSDPSHGGSGPPSNTWFLGPTRLQIPNGISVSSAFFAGLTIVTDRPTNTPIDHTTVVRFSNRPYLSTAMRPNNNMQFITTIFQVWMLRLPRRTYKWGALLIQMWGRDPDRYYTFLFHFLRFSDAIRRTRKNCFSECWPPNLCALLGQTVWRNLNPVVLA